MAGIFDLLPIFTGGAQGVAAGIKDNREEERAQQREALQQQNIQSEIASRQDLSKYHQDEEKRKQDYNAIDEMMAPPDLIDSFNASHPGANLSPTAGYKMKHLKYFHGLYPSAYQSGLLDLGKQRLGLAAKGLTIKQDKANQAGKPADPAAMIQKDVGQIRTQINNMQSNKARIQASGLGSPDMIAAYDAEIARLQGQLDQRIGQNPALPALAQPAAPAPAEPAATPVPETHGILESIFGSKK